MSLLQEKISNPLDFYQTPEQVATDQSLSHAEKIKILTSWLNDIQLRETAEGENMRSVSNNCDEHIAKIEELLREYHSKPL